MQTCKFTLEHYEHILKTALSSGYAFVGFDGVKPERYCILRHDVDYVPEWSLRLGEIESRLGIKSTFFFQVSSKTYNLGDFYNRSVVEELYEMGHSIGVHVDLSLLDEIDCEDFIGDEKLVFESFTNIKPCEIVSIHNPTKEFFGKKIEGLRHTYEAEFFKEIKYLSDSQNWYEGCVCKIFSEKKYDKIQLLLHPYIWQEHSKDFLNNLAKVVIYRNQELENHFLKYHPTCKANEAEFKKAVRLVKE